MLAEQLARPFLHAFLLAGSFCALALAGLFRAVSGWTHLALLCTFALVACLLLVRDIRAFRTPRKRQPLRRLERHNGLKNGPLSALCDRPALGHPALWEIHVSRMREAVRRLRPCPPRLRVARLDPFGLRFLVLAGLAFMVFRHGDEAFSRMAQAVRPRPTPPAFWAIPDFEARIIPPAFTGMPAITLSNGKDSPPIAVPFGSVLHIRLPLPLAKHARLSAKKSLFPFALRNAMTLLLDRNETLALKGRIRTLARWDIRILPDAPPEVSWDNSPAATPQETLALSFHASDDYGLETLSLHMARAGNAAVDIPLPADGRKTVQGPLYLDLTAHPWAGSSVTLTLAGMDARGQQGFSKPATVILPQRAFSHPVAREIARIRKELLEKGARQQARKEIDALSENPKAFDGDITVFLALRSSAARLSFSAHGTAIAETAELLWKTALRLEDGGLSMALGKLEEIRRRLEQALDDPNATDAEIGALMEQFSKAFAKYLQTLAENMAQGMTATLAAPASMDIADLAAAMEDMQALAESGARDAARDMLSALSDLLQGISLKAPDPAAQAFWQDFSSLQEMAERQDDLLSETARAEAGDLPDMAGKQEALESDLEKTAQSLESLTGGRPDPMGRATDAMGRAAKLLRGGKGEAATAAQAEALENLRETLKEMMKQAMSGEKGGGKGGMPMGMGGSDPFGRRQGGTDPLGRPVDMQTRQGIGKTREILQILREKAGDMQRPPQERDYFNRLLKRF